MNFPDLKEVQDKPELLLSFSTRTLAWLTLEAEHQGDDMTFIAIQNLLTGRGAAENKLYIDHYRSVWPEHAKFRGYDK